MARGLKKLLKRLNAPKYWMLDKLGGAFAPKPSSGPHKSRECLPLILIMRNRLKYALTYREVIAILTQRHVLVDGKVRTDKTHPAGFMDVVSIPKTNENFRRANDTIKLDLEENKSVDFIKFDVGNVVMVTGGRNRGRAGVIKNGEQYKGSFETIHVHDATGHEFADDVVLRAICTNLKCKRWGSLKHLLPKLTNSIVNRVICEFKNSPQLALDFYNWVQEMSLFPPSLDSCCTLVHVLVKSRRFDDALFFMRNLISQEATPPLVVLRALFESYDRCGSSIAVFDALVRACAQVGDTEGAYDVIFEVRNRGFRVSIHAWNNFLSHVLELNEIDRFWKLYRGMGSFGYVENVNTFNLVVYALCKECRLVEAVSVVYRMLKGGVFANVVSFNMIVDGACKLGELDLALKVVRKMNVMTGDYVWPNSVTYNCIINGFCKKGRLVLAEGMLREMVEAGLEPSVRTYATLIDGYARWGSLEEALRLCDEMVERGLFLNVVVYNSILYWLYRGGGMEEVSLVLSDMIDKCVYPDQYSYAILTQGLCRNGYLVEALKLHSKILKANLIKDAFSLNILLNYICKSKNLALAKKLLGNMITRGLVPDVYTYGTMIYGYFKVDNTENALQVYDGMIKMDEKPNLVIYNSVINGLCKMASIDVAKLLVNELRKIKLFDAITFNTLISGYCISGQLDLVFSLTLEMKNLGICANRVTYNTLINLLCKYGCHEEVKELMKMMIMRGIRPDCITYTTLITHFNRNFNPKEVIALHDYMILKGVVPDQETYNAIVSPLLLA